MQNTEQYLSSIENPFIHEEKVEENWSWVILLGILVLIFVGFGIWVWSIPAPPAKIPFPRIEKSYDASIKTPIASLTLGNFSKNPKDGYPWCIPTWYAIRYVNKQGGYSKMGPWTKTPIVSGGTNFPGGMQFGNTCSLNQVTIGTKESLEYDVKNQNIVANVHWQTEKFDPTSDGEAIGQLITANDYGLKYILVNGFKGKEILGANPNHGNIVTCKGCI